MEKRCTVCQEDKPLTDFYRDKTRPDGRTHRCKPCDSKKARGWKLANPEAARTQSREWHANNRVKSRAMRQATEARSRIARARKARDRRARAAASMTDFDRRLSKEHRLALTGEPCLYCGRVKSRMENDHFFPIHLGGSDHWWNLVRSCHTCNRRKSAHCGTWALLMATESWADDDQGETNAPIGRPRKRVPRQASGRTGQRDRDPVPVPC